ncbi:MAG: hypothetical protein IT327_02640 [Anaerolineae bacterium]|jgi:hypothetical protein|nr:hypothetical protein [Anaerolineae bacterium]
MAKERLDIWFGDNAGTVVSDLLKLFDFVVPDEEAGQRDSKKAPFMRKLLEIDPQELKQLMYPEEGVTE